MPREDGQGALRSSVEFLQGVAERLDTKAMGELRAIITNGAHRIHQVDPRQTFQKIEERFLKIAGAAAKRGHLFSGASGRAHRNKKAPLAERPSICRSDPSLNRPDLMNITLPVRSTLRE